MKIAFLTPEYPHTRTGNSGGIGTSIKNLSKGLLEEGCQVRVLVYGQKEEGLFEDDGVVIQQIKNVKDEAYSRFEITLYASNKSGCTKIYAERISLQSSQ